MFDVTVLAAIAAAVIVFAAAALAVRAFVVDACRDRDAAFAAEQRAHRAAAAERAARAQADARLNRLCPICRDLEAEGRVRAVDRRIARSINPPLQ